MIMDTLWLWFGFIVFIIFLLALDLGVFHRKAHVPSLSEAVTWTVIWIAVALTFNVGIYFIYENHLLHAGQDGSENVLNGMEAAKLFLTGYLIEKSLSLDNIFVIGMVFSYFGVPRAYQHRVLFWGILGALVLRAAMILLGVALIMMFHWVLYVFGALLLYTAIKVLRHEDEEIHPENNPLVKLVRRFSRMTPTFHKARFFVKENGLWAATPMLLVLLTVECYDVIFALDSIPAIFAVTQDPFIVFTSNVFAILGLRSLYFVLSAMIAKFRYLQISISVILFYVGVKLLSQDVIRHFEIDDLINWVSLGVIVVSMLAGIFASIWVNRRIKATRK